MSETGATGEQVPLNVDLRGRWQKSAATEGERTYPDVLDLTVLEPGAGRYLGRKGHPEQAFLHWDAGTWRLTDDGRIEISTATDAIESWPVKVGDDELEIRTDDGVLTYRRTTGPDD
jgi:hypothetical protein